ncbi:amino acid permease [Solirubrobacter ginsenosidimutans]|uniref:Amino acid permease n=1 Tax=Solirubrobacter ginsenosidimutans TaxID=490573 RepID=A0A9X3MWY7_9ACTN|nr:amino acid permease [Solirubrobacter ginsenosidimutans]MDA0162757.1 amino acid permease [Solirubrobacter ginsenosidimutans]
MVEESGGLQSGLKRRHVTMISLGGVIGAGLFVGSGAVINQTGPAAVLSYLAAGLLVVLVMRMLGEMAVANPSTGSFADYAGLAMGNWARFVVGWLYWYFWVIVLAVEAAAGAGIIQEWLPGVPIWASSLVLMLALTATNLVSVKAFGEFEFWFASIKVVAILVFIAIAMVYVIGHGVPELTANGGFAPKGGVAILSGIVIVIFAFVGAEIATIAAAESKEPGEAVTRATNSVIVRVLTFYVLSIFLIVAILPWNSAELGKSPFAAALGEIGFPAAEQVMNAVVLTAVLSCLNSGLYVASRMNFALARSGDAPQWMVRLNGRGVPARAILIATSVGFLSVIANVISPEKVFLFLLNSSGAVALFVYLLIAVSQLVLRRRLEKENPEHIQVRMWLYPYLTWFTIAAIVVVIGSMAFVDDVRSQLYLGLLSVAVVLAAYWLKSRRGGAGEPAGEGRFTRESDRSPERSATPG